VLQNRFLLRHEMIESFDISFHSICCAKKWIY
jgi:hypothetical protein